MLFLPSAMSQINFFLQESDIEKSVIELARLQSFHLNTAENEDFAAETGRWNSLLATYHDLEQHLDGLLNALGVDRQPMIPPQVMNPSGDAAEIKAVLEEAEEAIGAFRKKKKEAEAEKDHLRRLLQEVRLLASVEMPVEEIRNPDFLHWVVGTLPEENLRSLRYALFEKPRKGKRHRGRGRTQKINIFIHEEEIEAVALSLVRLEDFHLVRTKEETWSEKTPRWNELADTYEDQVERLEKLLSILEIEPAAMPPYEQAVPSRDADEIGERLSAIESDLSDWRTRWEERIEEKRRLDSQVREMESLVPLQVPVQEIREASFLYWVVGRIPKENLEHLRAVLFQIPMVVLPLSVNGGPDHDIIVAATTRDCATILDRAMSGLFVEPIRFHGDLQGTPEHCLRQLEKRVTAAEDNLADLEKERRQKEHDWYQEVLTLWRMAASNLETAKAVSGFARHDDVFLVSGRVPERAIDSVAVALENATRGRSEIEILEPMHQGKEDVPVEMMLFRIPLLLVPIGREGDRLLIVAATTHKHADVLDRALQGALMERIPLPREIRGIPSKVLPELEERIEEAEQRIADLRRDKKKLAEHWAERLRALRHEVAGNLRIIRAITRLSRHGETFLISGWAAKEDIERVVATMETASQGRVDVEIITAEAGGRRFPPTRMRNPTLFRPFEAIVRTFGAPGYDEIDPTPLAALSFTVMYGMMFGDAGHGLLLALGGLLILYYSKKRLLHALGGVVLACGLSAAFFGFLYGSLFGREDIIAAWWINPINDMLDLLAFSVIGGVILLSVGYLASIANAVRTREWGELLFGRGGILGAVFYWLLIGGGFAVYKGSWSVSFLLLMLVAAAMLLFLQEPLSRWVMKEKPLLQENTGSMAVRGFFQVYETILSHVSNTFSFIRLGAFAITHAAFMQVIFYLAESAGGLLGRWSIIVLGTLLVVGFEGLVVGIQALRLEYYEFFSKFYGGRGISFRPFSLYESEKE